MSLTKPISVGPVTIDAPVILAPMTGVTDLPFRKIVKRYGAGLTVSEMIASQAMIRETRQSLQKAAWDPVEEPVSLQLAGCAPEAMAEAAKLNEQRGAAIIDINMGCPVKKVVNGEAGSALMRDLPLAAAIIDATVKAVKVPVTLKMRMGWCHDSLNAPELGADRRRSGRPDDHRPRPHPKPDVQGIRRLDLRQEGETSDLAAGNRQRRHLQP
jgi:tRNA-dihydrouridine synthase B